MVVLDWYIGRQGIIELLNLFFLTGILDTLYAPPTPSMSHSRCRVSICLASIIVS